MVDHEDSFVHTLAGYFRQTGAEVVTYRTGFPLSRLNAERPDLMLLSPGPGRPSDFDLSRSIDAALERGLPVFGVCLGLQGIVEHFGGGLDILPTPMHGKPSRVRVLSGGIFEGLPEVFEAGRYHSLFARRESLPGCLRVTAETEDGLIMGIEHRSLPIAAVQFHPESIMSLAADAGITLVRNVVGRLRA
jgi:anthranilate synthase